MLYHPNGSTSTWFDGVANVVIRACLVLGNARSFSSPRYLRHLITILPSQSTRSFTLVTLLQPSVDSSLKVTNHSFQYAAPHLWNKLPPTLCVSYQFDPSSSPSSSPSDLGPLVDISCGVFHSCLKTFIFSKSFPP